MEAMVQRLSQYLDALSDTVQNISAITQRTRTVSEDLQQAERNVNRAGADRRALQQDDTADSAALWTALTAIMDKEQDVLGCRAALDRLAQERQALDDSTANGLRTSIPPAWSGAGSVTTGLSADLFGRGISGMAEWIQGLPEGAEGDPVARWLVEQLTAEEFDALLAACPQLAIRLMGEDTTGAFAAQYPDLTFDLNYEQGWDDWSPCSDETYDEIPEAFTWSITRELTVSPADPPGTVQLIEPIAQAYLDDGWVSQRDDLDQDNPSLTIENESDDVTIRLRARSLDAGPEVSNLLKIFVIGPCQYSPDDFADFDPAQPDAYFTDD